MPEAYAERFYLVGVLTCSHSKEEHLQHLHRVFMRMREQQPFFKVSNCGLASQRVQSLGFVIGPGGAYAKPDKLETITALPEILQNRRQLRRFVGRVGYRHLIPSFNGAGPPIALYRLLKDNPHSVRRPRHCQALRIINGH